VRQIKELYFRPEDKAEPFEYPEPETEEEVAEWCKVIAETMGGPGAAEWAERAPRQWAKEKAAREAANGDRERQNGA
jgi:hypothetical protein